MKTLQLSDTEADALTQLIGRLSPKLALKFDLDTDQAHMLAQVWDRLMHVPEANEPQCPWEAPEPNKVPELPLAVAVNRILEKWRADALYHRGAKLECAKLFKYISAQRHKTIELTLVRLVTELEAAIARV